ncbi:MAG: hypothetical protein IH586_13990, partial [Anaerolineaceae bacterium]|nr:hypothetical protein [Anaerolineaceae bacterium]
VCTQLHPQEIHIEPVYLSGRAAASAYPSGYNLAETFAEHFTKARDRGEQSSIPVLFSGTRPWDVHGSYCNIFRGVLNLVPGDVATPCFKLSDITQVNQPGASIGLLESERFFIDYPKISDLRILLAKLPRKCSACFNQYHCARGCPDDCLLSGNEHSEAPDQFTLPEYRCRVQMLLANAVIERAAIELQRSQGNRLGGTFIRVNG